MAESTLKGGGGVTRSICNSSIGYVCIIKFLHNSNKGNLQIHTYTYINIGLNLVIAIGPIAKVSLFQRIYQCLK